MPSGGPKRHLTNNKSPKLSYRCSSWCGIKHYTPVCPHDQNGLLRWPMPKPGKRSRKHTIDMSPNYLTPTRIHLRPQKLRFNPTKSKNTQEGMIIGIATIEAVWIDKITFMARK